MDNSVNRYSGVRGGKDLEGRPVKVESSVEETDEIDLPPSTGQWVPTAFFDEVSTQLENYPELLSLYRDLFPSPGDLLTARGIDILLTNLRRNPDITTEATQFLDIVNIIEMMNFGVRPYTTVELFTISVLKNRGGIATQEMAVKKASGVLRSNGSVGQDTSLKGILVKNPIIIGIYMYLLIADMTNILDDLG